MIYIFIHKNYHKIEHKYKFPVIVLCRFIFYASQKVCISVCKCWSNIPYMYYKVYVMYTDIEEFIQIQVVLSNESAKMKQFKLIGTVSKPDTANTATDVRQKVESKTSG